MIVYTKPKVYLIARPDINTSEVEKFLQAEEALWAQDDGVEITDADSLVEFAGRICYVSFGQKQGRKTNRSYLQNVLEQGHGSVFEHAQFTFLVTQASRGFTHEMVRHRAGFAFSQESTHYIDYKPETAKLCVDPRMALEPSILEEFIRDAEEDVKVYRETYEQLLLKGYKKKEACSMARQKLPTGLEAKLVFSANVRALRHFIEARCNEHNVLEIAEVAGQVLEIMKGEAPNAFGDMFLEKAGNGSVVRARSAYRKV